ncbi:MAG: hypothetical protein E6Q88_05395 [Lysobacteraceae bacterium]|nr:MAG: hypothetical protein E6Q88_05395 [Xanthomonadaceae bacterium]
MKSKLLLRAVLSLSSLAATTSAVAADCAPLARFEVAIGGFFGPSFEVRAEGPAQLVYRANRHSFVTAPGTKQTKIKVSPAQWRAFCAEIEDIGVWSWKSRYENSSVNDGTKWSVRMQFGANTLDASGYNAYPEQERFNRFLRAVRELIGGREFR